MFDIEFLLEKYYTWKWRHERWPNEFYNYLKIFQKIWNKTQMSKYQSTSLKSSRCQPRNSLPSTRASGSATTSSLLMPASTCQPTSKWPFTSSRIWYLERRSVSLANDHGCWFFYQLDIKGRDVRYIQIPQYDGLSIKDISNFLEDGHQHVFQYMPDAQEIHKVPKQWLCNIANSILKDQFSDWVKSQVELRNENVKSKKNMMIQMDPELAAAFAASSKVSRKCWYHF